MAKSLHPHAALAQDSLRALMEVLSSSRSQWDDAARQAFDQQYVEVVLASGKKVANELTSLAADLARCLAALP